MKYAKNMFVVLTVMGFSCSNAFAMDALLVRATKHVCRKATTHKTAKRLVTSKASKKSRTPDKISKPQSFNEILETPTVAKKRPPSYPLPKDFFVEDREGVTVERVSEGLLYVHQNAEIEREAFINDIIKQNDPDRDKQYVLLHEKDGKVEDRRIKVIDPLDSQYLPICHLYGSYKLNDQDLFTYRGSGFRNSFNQIITAGHILFLDKERVEEFYKKKNRALPKKDFLFEKELLTLQIIFGYREEAGITKYSHICTVNGKHSFVQNGRDLGVIQLPTSQKALLDDKIGNLPTMLFPDQPHEYMGKPITIVGYPGVIKNPTLYFHSGPIINVNPSKVVFYEVDTTKGNSGSPGFPGVIGAEKNKHINPVFLTHTHGRRNSKVNGGEGYDQDFYDFMVEYYKLTSNLNEL